jgi:hypothetical protein
VARARGELAEAGAGVEASSSSLSLAGDAKAADTRRKIGIRFGWRREDRGCGLVLCVVDEDEARVFARERVGESERDDLVAMVGRGVCSCIIRQAGDALPSPDERDRGVSF